MATVNGMQDTLSYLLVQVAKAHRQRAQQAFTDAGLYVGQETILMQLWREDGLALSQIIDRSCVQPATITKMINRMEKAGLVERHPDPDDGRAKRIYLTDAGRGIEGEVKSAWQDLENATLQNLSEDDQEVMRDLLNKMLDGLNELAPCEPSPQ
jgi:DNA-binding MarR family transcriptional regulator